MRDQESWAENSVSLFASRAWASVLTSLGAAPVFAWNRRLKVGLILPVFSIRGIKIAYFGFPVAGPPWDEYSGSTTVENVRQLASLVSVSLIRCTVSMTVEAVPSMTSARPEVWINDLQAWTGTERGRLRRDLAFARRIGAELKIVKNEIDAALCFQLYRSTLGARGGTLRYSEAYFRQLLALARVDDRMQVFSAVDSSGRARAFSVMGLHGGNAYYMHSAADEVGKRAGASDLLLESIATSARCSGAKRLTLMASPWEQPGLHKFKKKWGDSEGFCVTHDVPATPTGFLVRLVARWLSRADRVAFTRSSRRGCIER